MANTTNLTLASVGVAMAGQWAQGKPLTPRIIVAGTFLAVSLALLSEVDTGLAEAFAALILITALLTYGKPVIDKMGIAK